MNASARLIICGAVALFGATTASGQATIQPTPPPSVTADAEPWYWKGEPLMFAGTYYYPAGARMHFNANEMVRSGLYEGVPLYMRTTIEPYSLVYVPLAGGLMQPYERRREGELAGMAGSSAPSFPIATSRDVPLGVQPVFAMREAAAPPVIGSRDAFVSGSPTFNAPSPTLVPLWASRDTVTTATGTENQVTPLGTQPAAALPTVVAPPPLIRRADAANAMSVEFDRTRWFSSGHPTPLDASRFTRVGEVQGFPVYTARGRDHSTIYVTISRDMDVVAPYSKRK
jgi:hypothetical protein